MLFRAMLLFYALKIQMIPYCLDVSQFLTCQWLPVILIPLSIRNWWKNVVEKKRGCLKKRKQANGYSVGVCHALREFIPIIYIRTYRSQNVKRWILCGHIFSWDDIFRANARAKATRLTWNLTASGCEIDGGLKNCQKYGRTRCIWHQYGRRVKAGGSRAAVVTETSFCKPPQEGTKVAEIMK